MGVYAIKPRFQKMLVPVGRRLIARGVHPDVLNVLGLMTALGMAAAMVGAAVYPVLFWLLPLGAFVRTACNALDGMVARAQNLSSAQGEIYNEFLDRVSDVAILLGIGLGGLSGWDSVAIALSATLLSSYLGIVNKAAGGSRVYAGICGKADRMILVGAGGIAASFLSPHCVFAVVTGIIAVGSAITIVERIVVIRREWAQ